MSKSSAHRQKSLLLSPIEDVATLDAAQQHQLQLLQQQIQKNSKKVQPAAATTPTTNTITTINTTSTSTTSSSASAASTITPSASSTSSSSGPASTSSSSPAMASPSAPSSSTTTSSSSSSFSASSSSSLIAAPLTKTSPASGGTLPRKNKFGLGNKIGGGNTMLLRNRSKASILRRDTSPQVSSTPPPVSKVFRSDINLDEIKSGVVQLAGLKYAILEMDSDIEGLKNEIASVLEKLEKHRQIQHNKEILKSRIHHLKHELDAHYQILQNERAIIQTERRDLLERSDQVMAAQSELLARQQSLQENMQLLELQREQVSMTSKQCVDRQRKLIRTLRLIYPISPVSSISKRLAIADLSLYKKDTLGTDDEAATTLGFIAHCVLILSKLHHVQLKHQVYPMASRSYIRSDLAGGGSSLSVNPLGAGSTDTAQQSTSPGLVQGAPSLPTTNQLLPLFLVRGSDKSRYLKAVILLNRDIIQILRACGYTGKSSRDLLVNLRFLMEA